MQINDPSMDCRNCSSRMYSDTFNLQKSTRLDMLVYVESMYWNIYLRGMGPNESNNIIYIIMCNFTLCVLRLGRLQLLWYCLVLVLWPASNNERYCKWFAFITLQHCQVVYACTTCSVVQCTFYHFWFIDIFSWKNGLVN